MHCVMWERTCIGFACCLTPFHILYEIKFVEIEILEEIIVPTYKTHK